jgi:hypothetical protein
MNKVTLSVIAILIIGIGILTYLFYPASPISTNNEQERLSMSSPPRDDSVHSDTATAQLTKSATPKWEYIDCSKAPAMGNKELCGKYIQDMKKLSKNMEDWAHSVDRSNSGTTSSGIAQ